MKFSAVVGSALLAFNGVAARSELYTQEFSCDKGMVTFRISGAQPGQVVAIVGEDSYDALEDIEDNKVSCIEHNGKLSVMPHWDGNEGAALDSDLILSGKADANGEALIEANVGNSACYTDGYGIAFAADQDTLGRCTSSDVAYSGDFIGAAAVLALSNFRGNGEAFDNAALAAFANHALIYNNEKNEFDDDNIWVDTSPVFTPIMSFSDLYGPRTNDMYEVEGQTTAYIYFGIPATSIKESHERMDQIRTAFAKSGVGENKNILTEMRKVVKTDEFDDVHLIDVGQWRTQYELATPV